MKHKTDKREFYRFLKERNVFPKFCQERMAFLLSKEEKNIFPYITSCRPMGNVKKVELLFNVDSSFVWDETIDGFGFWDDLNRQWQKYCGQPVWQLSPGN